MDFHKIERKGDSDEGLIPLEPTSPPPPPPPSTAGSSRPASGSSGGARPQQSLSKPGAKPAPSAAMPGRLGRPDLNAKCPKCGYSIIGLKGDKCPECGVNLVAAMGTAGRKAVAKQQLKAEYVWAIGALLGGAVALAGALAMNGALDLMGFVLLRYVVFVPVGLGVYLLCCAIWIGFDQPIGITVLRLAAIYMMCDACFMGVAAITPVKIVGRVFSLVLMAALMIKWLDIEWDDAKYVTILTWGAWWVTSAVLMVALA